MWQDGIFRREYWWQAKVYVEGSRFGINGGRVSKLTICATPTWDHTQVLYNYDRGLDFDNCPTGVLEGILAEIGN